MWKVISNTKTLIGLAAVSMALSFLFATKVIESGIIKTSYEMTVILLFFILFILAIFILAVVWSDSPEKRSISQTASGESHKQVIKTNPTAQGNIAQNAKGKNHEQNIEE